MLKILTGLLQRINDATHTPHKHDVRPLLKEMRRSSRALSQLEQAARQRVKLYDTLDDLYANQVTEAKVCQK